MAKTALIVGASGLVGGYCLQYLLEDAKYDQIISLGRRKLDKVHPKLQQDIVDFDKISTYGELLKADDVYCTLGTTIKDAGSKEQFKKVDYQYVVDTAKAALELAAKKFLVVTAMGAGRPQVFNILFAS
jgi:uncharacterized protein YbjT (DUF2867 family)